MCLGVDFGNMDLGVHFFDQVREFFSHYYFTCCSFSLYSSLSNIPILKIFLFVVFCNSCRLFTLFFILFLFVPLTAEWAMQLSVCSG